MLSIFTMTLILPVAEVTLRFAKPYNLFIYNKD